MTDRRTAVLHVVNRLADNGGAEVSLVQSLTRLQAQGMRHAVLPLFADEATRLQGELRRAGVRLYDPLDRPALRAVGAVRRAIREFQPHIVHSNLWDADLAARLAAFLEGVPSLVSVVNTQYSEAAFAQVPSARRLDLVRRADGFLGRHFTARFHALTEATAAAAVAALHIPRAKIEVVPRGRDRSFLGTYTPARRAVARARLELEAGDEVILNVARQERQKGQVHLVRAFAKVTAEHPRAVLLIAGRRGAASAGLDEAVAASSVADRIRVLGNREDIPDLLCAADVFAFSSLWEGLGGAVLEAMAMDLPVVAFDVPAVREVLDGTGLLAPLGDEGAFAAHLAKFLDDPAARHAAAAAARARFEANYTIEAAAAGMHRLYTDLHHSTKGHRPAGRIGRMKARLVDALSRRHRNRGLGGALAYMLGRPFTHLVHLERYQVLARPTAGARVRDVSGLTIERLEPNSSTLKGNSLVEGSVPGRREGLPRGRSAWLGLRDTDGRLRARMCIELETERGSHRGWSPQLREGEAVLSGLWVDPDVRAKNAGRALVEAAIATARDEFAVARVYGLVNQYNAPSVALLRMMLSFREVGHAWVIRLGRRVRFGVRADLADSA